MLKIALAAAALAAGVVAPNANAQAVASVKVVSAQFRHNDINRATHDLQLPAYRIKTGCFRPKPGMWKCDLAGFDVESNPPGVLENPAVILHFRFTLIRGVLGYKAPRGPRWRQSLPGVRRGYSLLGVLTRVSVGQDYGTASKLARFLDPWRNCCR